MTEQSTVTAVGRVILASGTARALGVIRGLILAKLLAPDTYGVWVVVWVIFGYVQYADLGSATAAFRDLTAAVGRGDSARASQAAGWMGGLKLGAVLAVSLAVAVGGFWSSLEPPLRLGLFILPGVALTSTLLSLVILRWQAHGNIEELNRVITITAAADLALSVAFTLLWGLLGLLVAAVVTPVLTLVWSAKRQGFVSPAPVPLIALRRYLWIGFPMFALALIDHSLIEIDRVIVGVYFSVRELGVYNLAMMPTEVMRSLGMAAGAVLGPELIRKHTRADANIQAIRGQTLLPVQLYASVLPWVAAVLWVGGGHVITRFYPLYSEAVLPMRILLIASYFLIVNGGVTSFLFAIDKHRRNLLILTSALCFNVLADVILLQNGWGPEAVAVGSLITYVLYAVVHLWYVGSYFNLTRREWMEFYAGVFLPAMYLAAILILLGRWIAYESSLMATTGTLVTVFLLLVPLGIRSVSLARRLEST